MYFIWQSWGLRRDPSIFSQSHRILQSHNRPGHRPLPPFRGLRLMGLGTQAAPRPAAPEEEARGLRAPPSPPSRVPEGRPAAPVPAPGETRPRQRRAATIHGVSSRLQPTAVMWTVVPEGPPRPAGPAHCRPDHASTCRPRPTRQLPTWCVHAKPDSWRVLS